MSVKNTSVVLVDGFGLVIHTVHKVSTHTDIFFCLSLLCPTTSTHIYSLQRLCSLDATFRVGLVSAGENYGNFFFFFITYVLSYLQHAAAIVTLLKGSISVRLMKSSRNLKLAKLAQNGDIVRAVVHHLLS